MSRYTSVGVEIVDVDGRFRRLVKQAAPMTRKFLAAAVKETAAALARRIARGAPVGPDAPHIHDAVTFTARGLTGKAGFIERANEQAAPGNPATQGDVALFNEYTPNRQPFMLPAAEVEAPDYARRARTALEQVERALSGGA
jgi:hypothetical protein